MTTMMFIAGAILLTAFSVILIHGTSPFSLTGCVAYERKRTRRLIGKILLIIAAQVLLIGIISACCDFSQ